jgi:hypothetical protein
MDVSAMGRSLGVTSVARRQTNETAVPATAAPSPEVTRQARFDLNGDGRIEDRGTLYGGDGFLTWHPPGGIRNTPTVRPVVHGEGATPPAATASVRSPVSELRHAQDAYSHYGRSD